ncbi:NAD-dependent succinate-semialdehyde dehydrogenase [Euzebya tangerina]|uniref:NAD-dependent succinate-semialdehyde dehydrogenase n=1 Tax=Euzebya tangerina TaxID=591198 RepID=UPI000E324344|nr:NAD-dependent succinate-semialdehyde dehydrogenase [Euzebya tangerina]
MQTQMLIGGDFTDAADGSTMPVEDPATGETIAEVAAGGPADVVTAVARAHVAQSQWAATAPRDRAETLRRVWQLMTDAQEELADLITAENGKPLADARGEVAYAAEFFRWNAEETVRLRGELGVAPSGTNRILVHHPPIGVVAMITPWNFPAAMITRKLAPALGAGNGVVIKPPAQTPLTALRIGELLGDAGVPDGLVNVVPTADSAGWFDTCVDQEPVRMVSFTGSTEVGRVLLRRAADRVLKTVMELGGNAPFIVFDDADLDAAVEGAMLAKMRHSAETCTAANRFYAHRSVATDFAERFAAAMAEVQIGPGADDATTCGPLIDAEAVQRMVTLVEEARDDGARVLTGGGVPDRPGHFFNPTVLGEVGHASSIARTEIFGPVAPVIPFEDTDAVIEMANDTEMGLTGYVYTEDLRRGLAVSERIRAGMIGLNRGLVSDPAAPFGGMKQSGLGREGSTDGIYEFCETQYIATSW